MDISDGLAIGVDACSDGWFSTIYNSELQTRFYETIEEVIQEYQEQRILVDIPIGLNEESRRTCDEEAREILGCRGSSVFRAPCRAVLDVDDPDEASDIQRKKVGDGLSRQAFHLTDKIAEVDELVAEESYESAIILESHPELCFHALNG